MDTKGRHSGKSPPLCYKKHEIKILEKKNIAKKREVRNQMYFSITILRNTYSNILADLMEV